MQLTQTVQVRQVNHIGQVGQKWKKQTLKNLDTKSTADRKPAGNIGRASNWRYYSVFGYFVSVNYLS
jgi:hypothetical protein